MMMVWMWERGNVVVGNRDDAVRADARNRDAKCRIFKKGCENKRKFRVCTLAQNVAATSLTSWRIGVRGGRTLFCSFPQNCHRFDRKGVRK